MQNQARNRSVAAALMAGLTLLSPRVASAGKDIKTGLMPPNKVVLVVYSQEHHTLAVGINPTITIRGALNAIYDSLNKELPAAGVQLISEEKILGSIASKKTPPSKSKAPDVDPHKQEMERKMEEDLAKVPPHMREMVRQRMQASMGQLGAMQQPAPQGEAAADVAQEDEEDRAFASKSYSTAIIQANRGLARKQLGKEESKAILDSLGRTSAINIRVEPLTNKLILHVSVNDGEGKETGSTKVSAKFPGSIKNSKAGETWIEQIRQTVPLVVAELISELKD